MKTEHTYRAYSDLFSEIFKANDLPTATELLRFLPSIVSKDNMEELSGSILSSAMTEASSDMQLLFLERFGMTKEAAGSYINSCLHDKGKDRSHLKIASSYVGDLYGSMLAGAFVMGDVQVCKELYNHNKDFRPLFSISNGEKLVDGERVDNRSEIMAEISSGELRVISEILVEAGMDYVFSGQYRLLGSSSLRKSEESTLSGKYTGLLPSIHSGLIKNPELFLAFKNEASKSGCPRVFSKVPCWVKRGELTPSPDVTIFRPFHGVKVKDWSREVCYKTFSDLAEMKPSDRRDSIHYGSVQMKVEPCQFTTQETMKDFCESIFSSANNIIKSILPINILSGLGMPEGYDLAVIDLAVLDGFPIGSMNPENKEKAYEFASSFFPASVLFNSHSGSRQDILDTGHVGIDSDYGLELFRGLSDSTLKDDILNAVPHELWVDLFKHCSWRMGHVEILNAKEFFGFDDSISRIELDEASVKKLFESGYKFYNDGANCSFKDEQESKDLQAFVCFIKMGGWPSKLPRPSSVEEGLQMAVRKKNDPIYRYYLRSVGSEDVIKLAKTQSHFNLIYEVFPREELTHLLKLMPRSVKARHLEDDLGM